MINTAAVAMTDAEHISFLGDIAPSETTTNTVPDTSVKVHMTDASAIKRFMLAGNAYFTLKSARTGERFTYRIARAKDSATYRNALPTYFVSLLSGSDNTNDYRYLGLLQDLGIRWGVRPTRNSRVATSAPSFKGIDWFVKHAFGGRLPDSVEFYHAGRCGRCARLLTVPESIEMGLGPECAEKRL